MDRQQQQYENFLTNYTGRRPAPPTPFEKFLSCIGNGDLEGAKAIYNERHIDINLFRPAGMSTTVGALHIAARDGHLNCVEFLVEEGADVDLKEGRRKTALHLAAGSGHVDVVRYLIKHKASLNLIDKFGRTPIVWAISAGKIDIVQELVNAGAQLNVQGNWHPLHEACKHGYLEIAKLLIAHGAQINNPTEFKGCKPWSPLHIATREGHLNCINMLIDAGADVHSKNAGGHTPLHEAAYRGYTDIARRLLQHNANPNAVNNQKRSPLHEACAQGKVLTAVLLLDAGSKPNAQDMIFETPMHLALRARHPPPTTIALITILIQYGASPSIMGNNEETPIDILHDTGQAECLEILKEALENPLTLMQMCKVIIRRKLRHNLDRVDKLPLPLSVQSFIKDDTETHQMLLGEYS